MSYFKAKMHQIRFRLGLCPRPRWGSLQRSPDPLLDLRGPTSKGRGGGRTGGQGGEGRDEEKRKWREKGKGRGGEGEEGWEEKFKGAGGMEGKGVRKRGGEGKFGWPCPPTCFFLEPRLLLRYHNFCVLPLPWVCPSFSCR